MNRNHNTHDYSRRPVRNLLEVTEPWVWNQDLVGKIIIRTGPSPRTGDRSYVGEKLKVFAITDKLIRGSIVDSSCSVWQGREVMLTMEEYGDGQWELN